MSGVPSIEATNSTRTGRISEGAVQAEARPSGYLLATIAVGVAFYISGRLGQLVAIDPGTVTPIWLPSGFALFGVLVFGPRIWPGIWIAAIMTDGLPVLATETWSELLRSISVGVAIATGSTLEPILGAHLFALARGRAPADPLASVRLLASFVVLAGCISCSVNATIGVTTLSIAGLMPWSIYSTAWATWWVGNTVGVILIVPLLISWRVRPVWLMSSTGWIKPTLLVVALAISTELFFGDWLDLKGAVPMGLIMLPSLIWLAYSYGRHGATLGGVLVAAIALINTAQGEGLFAGDDLNDSLLVLQICIGMIVTTGLAMSAAVNERRAAEQQAHRLNSELAHAGRVSLTGEMAAGMAHEFHQPLAVIANYANSCLIRLRRGEALGEEAREPLQNIVNETMRAARVIRGIRGFLQKSEQQQALSDVNTLVADSLELSMIAGDDAGVDVTLSLDGRSPSAWVEPTQFTQIMVNLLLNAMDAMNELPRDAKRISVTTRSKIDAVEVRVADSGFGLSEEDREQCFERFYTTKDDGLGMGLAICRTLAELHGGRMWVEKSSLGGAEFCFTVSKTPLSADEIIPPGKL